MDRFSVSIKGVLEINDKYLLRKNERDEYELLGGRLEMDDESIEYRVKTEFLEESGIVVEPLRHREPWLYEIGIKNIIIVPLLCKALSVPRVLSDEDGGTLHWIPKDEINSLFMPQGYIDTINKVIPHKSYSIPANFYFKIIPNYVERTYLVRIMVEGKNRIIISDYLPHFYAPRDYIREKIGNCDAVRNAKIDFISTNIDFANEAIQLNYRIDI